MSTAKGSFRLQMISSLFDQTLKTTLYAVLPTLCFACILMAHNEQLYAIEIGFTS